jgi:selenocysteine lyase/cysteine desulfurase
LGAYGLGLAYFGEKFHQGTPIENNWINHEGSENFANLVNYNENFKAKAARYDMGESSNFVLVPMLSEGIRQLIEWTPNNIQAYCKSITQDVLVKLQEQGYFIEDPEYRANHLFGIYLSKESSIEEIKKKLSDKRIVVSHRGNAIRIAPNVYNTKTDLEKLLSCFV